MPDYPPTIDFQTNIPRTLTFPFGDCKIVPSKRNPSWSPSYLYAVNDESGERCSLFATQLLHDRLNAASGMGKGAVVEITRLEGEKNRKDWDVRIIEPGEWVPVLIVNHAEHPDLIRPEDGEYPPVGAPAVRNPAQRDRAQAAPAAAPVEPAAGRAGRTPPPASQQAHVPQQDVGPVPEALLSPFEVMDRLESFYLECLHRARRLQAEMGVYQPEPREVSTVATALFIAAQQRRIVSAEKTPGHQALEALVQRLQIENPEALEPYGRALQPVPGNPEDQRRLYGELKAKLTASPEARQDTATPAPAPAVQDEPAAPQRASQPARGARSRGRAAPEPPPLAAHPDIDEDFDEQDLPF